MSVLFAIAPVRSSSLLLHYFSLFFFFNDTATTEIYTLSLHDALPISDLSAPAVVEACLSQDTHDFEAAGLKFVVSGTTARSEEHTSELQSRQYLVCRLLLEKKKKKKKTKHKIIRQNSLTSTTRTMNHK